MRLVLPPLRMLKLMLLTGALGSESPRIHLINHPIRAAYGYDVNAPEFKEWQASQQQQYAQYYASQGYDAAAYGAAAAAPQPSEAAPPPPPPP